MKTVPFSEAEQEAILKSCSVFANPVLKDFFLNALLQPEVSDTNIESCLNYFYNLGGQIHGQSEHKELALASFLQILNSPHCPKKQLYVIFNMILNLLPSEEYLQKMAQSLNTDQLIVLQQRNY